VVDDVVAFGQYATDQQGVLTATLQCATWA
jgi:hypothetical protein